MKYQVVISTQAAAEFLTAAEWWAEHRDPRQAARWFTEFDAKIRGLGDNPYRYAVADENASFPYQLRELNFGLSSRPTHRALFTVVEPDVVVMWWRTPLKFLADRKLHRWGRPGARTP